MTYWLAKDWLFNIVLLCPTCNVLCFLLLTFDAVCCSSWWCSYRWLGELVTWPPAWPPSAEIWQSRIQSRMPSLFRPLISLQHHQLPTVLSTVLLQPPSEDHILCCILPFLYLTLFSTGLTKWHTHSWGSTCKPLVYIYTTMCTDLVCCSYWINYVSSTSLILVPSHTCALRAI